MNKMESEYDTRTIKVNHEEGLRNLAMVILGSEGGIKGDGNRLYFCGEKTTYEFRKVKS